MNIAKIMIPKISTTFLREQNTVRQGLELFKRHGYTAVPVLDEDGKYVGSVSEGDFLRFILALKSTDMKKFEKHRVSEILRQDFCPAVSIDASVEEVLSAVSNQNFVPVVDDRGCLCGIITRRRVLDALAPGTDKQTDKN